jgi:rod shape determining protein RodA
VRRGSWANLDWLLIGATAVIALVGVLVVKSAVRGDPPNAGAWQKQIMWLALGLVALAGGTLLDYRVLARRRRAIYFATILLLAAVLFLSPSVKETHRWFVLGPLRLQPSELAKVLIVATLAGQLAALGAAVRGFGGLVPTLAHIGIPLVLILKEPDLGTCLALLVVWFVMLFYSGTRPLNLLIVLLALSAGFAGMWRAGVIKDYQKDRLTAFIAQKADPRGESYQVTQSKIAIGSGGLWGKGLFKGPQGRLHFIPDQHTDFIFTVVGEELGLAGSLATIILFALIVWRGMSIVGMAVDPYGRCLACGIVAVIGVQAFINIGMTLGIMPITGIPLPFMSYGGSSMMAMMFGIGLLESIHRRAKASIFT